MGLENEGQVNKDRRGEYKVVMRKVWKVMDDVFCLASGDGSLDVCPCQTLSHCIPLKVQLCPMSVIRQDNGGRERGKAAGQGNQEPGKSNEKENGEKPGA